MAGRRRLDSIYSSVRIAKRTVAITGKAPNWIKIRTLP